MTALEGEAEALVSAWDGVCDVVAGVRCAVDTLPPAQLASLYPDLCARASAALGVAGALPQGRLLSARVAVDTRGLAELTAMASSLGAVSVDIPRQLAHTEVRERQAKSCA